MGSPPNPPTAGAGGAGALWPCAPSYALTRPALHLPCSPASLELNPYRTRSFLDQPDNVKVGRRGRPQRRGAVVGFAGRSGAD